MNILITGGAGELGSRCGECLLRDGHNTTLLVRKKIKDGWSAGVRQIIADIRDEKIQEKLKGEAIDCVIHFAGVKREFSRENPIEAMRINGIGTMNLLNACVKLKIKKFIYISTFHIYGLQENGGWINEECNPRPVNNYGLTKYMGELICQQLCNLEPIEGVSLRVSNVYDDQNLKNEGVWNRVPNIFIKQIVKDKKITINSSGEQIRNFIYFDDIMQMIKICLDKKFKKYEIYNVGGYENISINEIVNIIEKIYSNIFDDMKGKSTGSADKEDGVSYYYDIGKAKSIGFNPKGSIQEIIKNNMLEYINSMDFNR